IFNEDRYFDVFVEYAKVDVDDVLIQISATNRGPETANLRLLPTIWFRNTWSWGSADRRPELRQSHVSPNPIVELEHPQMGKRWLYCEKSPELLFTENETNAERLWGLPNRHPYVKDSIHDYIIHDAKDAVNPEKKGTKASAHYNLKLAPGETAV